MRTIIFLIAIVPLLGISQDNNLSVLNNLDGKTFVAEGKWKDGSNFKQEIRFYAIPQKPMLFSDTKAYTDKEQTKFELINNGVIKFDEEEKKIKFWSYQTSGGVVVGNISIKGKNFAYHYPYGEEELTDYWEYVDENTYNLVVGIYENETWKTKYLETKFKLK